MLSQEMLNILGWKQEQLTSLQFIAFSYIKQGKYDIAQSLLETLEALNPSDLYTLKTLGAVYIETKNALKALDTLEKALKLDPQDEMTRFNRIQALVSLGLKKQALEDSEMLINAVNPYIKERAEAFILSSKIF
jgi:predicted Zn-dependent protease